MQSKKWHTKSHHLVQLSKRVWVMQTGVKEKRKKCSLFFNAKQSVSEYISLFLSLSLFPFFIIFTGWLHTAIQQGNLSPFSSKLQHTHIHMCHPARKCAPRQIEVGKQTGRQRETVCGQPMCEGQLNSADEIISWRKKKKKKQTERPLHLPAKDY